MSASSTTTLGRSRDHSTSALPKASRNESPLVPMRCGAAFSTTAIDKALDLLRFGVECGERVADLLGRQLHAAVPRRLIFHVTDALALCGVGDDHRRRILLRLRCIESGEDAWDIVTVDLECVPAEGTP